MNKTVEPVIELSNVTFHSDSQDDWLMWAFNVTVVQGTGDGDLDNTNCTKTNATDDGLVCVCARGYGGDLCDQPPSTSAPTSSAPTPAGSGLFYTDAQLLSDGFTAIVQFSGDVSPPEVLIFPHEVQCDDHIIDVPAIGGNGARCNFASPSTFRLSFGFEATIQLFDNVTLSPDAFGIQFEQRQEGFPKLLPPNPIPRPHLTLIGPQRIDTCADLFVLSAHTFSGNRRLSYNWRVTSPNGGFAASEQAKLDEFVVRNQSLLVVNASLLGSALAVNSTLIAENWLGGVSDATSLLTSRVPSHTAGPDVFLFTPNGTVVSVQNTLLITSRVTFSECSGPHALVFLWVQTQRPPGAPPTPIIDVSSQNLKLNPFALRPGVSCFNLTVIATRVPPFASESNSTTSGSAVVCVRATRPLPVALIAGGDRSVVVGPETGEDTSILDGSESYDPLGQPLVFAWFPDASCFGGGAPSLTLNNPNLILQTALLSPGAPCGVTLTVTTADGSLSNARVELTLVSIVSGISATIRINSPFFPTDQTFGASNVTVLLVNRETPLSMSALVSGNVQGEAQLIFSWADDSGFLDPTDPDQILTDPGSDSLVIRKEQLVEGRTHVFSINVSDSAAPARSAIARVVVRVAMAPNGGTCDVAPRSGIVLETEFSFACSGWRTPQPPLSYRFELRYLGLHVLLKQSAESLMVAPSLPIGNQTDGFTLNTRVIVSDRVGATSAVDLPVAVRFLGFMRVGGNDDVFDPATTIRVSSRVQAAIRGNLSQFAIHRRNWPGFVALLSSLDSLVPFVISRENATRHRTELLSLAVAMTNATRALSPQNALQAAQSGAVAVRNASIIEPTSQSQAANFTRTVLTRSVEIKESQHVSDTMPGVLSSVDLLGTDMAIAIIRTIQTAINALLLKTPSSGTDGPQDNVIIIGRTVAQRDASETNRALIIGVVLNFDMVTLGRSLVGRHVSGQLPVDIQEQGLRLVALRLARSDALAKDSHDWNFTDAHIRMPNTPLIAESAPELSDIIIRSNILNLWSAVNSTDVEADVESTRDASSLYSIDVFASNSPLSDPIIVPVDTGLGAESIRMAYPLTIPRGNPETRRFRCFFFNLSADEWSASGCALERVSDAGAAVCRCNHLTNFVVQAEELFSEGADSVDVALADLGAVAVANIADFPIILYILAVIYAIYLSILWIAVSADSELFENQVIRALKHRRRAERQLRGLEQLRGVPGLVGKPGDELSSDDDDETKNVRSRSASRSASTLTRALARRPIGSNTVLMRLLRRIRDENQPFRIQSSSGPNVSDRQTRELEYLQRVRRLSSGQRPDPKGLLARARRLAVERPHSSHQELTRRHNGFEVVCPPDLRDGFMRAAVDRFCHSVVVGAMSTLRARQVAAPRAPLSIERFWDSVRGGGRADALSSIRSGTRGARTLVDVSTASVASSDPKRVKPHSMFSSSSESEGETDRGAFGDPERPYHTFADMWAGDDASIDANKAVGPHNPTTSQYGHWSYREFSDSDGGGMGLAGAQQDLDPHRGVSPFGFFSQGSHDSDRTDSQDQHMPEYLADRRYDHFSSGEDEDVESKITNLSTDPDAFGREAVSTRPKPDHHSDASSGDGGDDDINSFWLKSGSDAEHRAPPIENVRPVDDTVRTPTPSATSDDSDVAIHGRALDERDRRTGGIVSGDNVHSGESDSNGSDSSHFGVDRDGRDAKRTVESAKREKSQSEDLSIASDAVRPRRIQGTDTTEHKGVSASETDFKRNNQVRPRQTSDEDSPGLIHRVVAAQEYGAHSQPHLRPRPPQGAATSSASQLSFRKHDSASTSLPSQTSRAEPSHAFRFLPTPLSSEIASLGPTAPDAARSLRAAIHAEPGRVQAQTRGLDIISSQESPHALGNETADDDPVGTIGETKNAILEDAPQGTQASVREPEHITWPRRSKAPDGPGTNPETKQRPAKNISEMQLSSTEPLHSNLRGYKDGAPEPGPSDGGRTIAPNVDGIADDDRIPEPSRHRSTKSDSKDIDVVSFSSGLGSLGPRKDEDGSWSESDSSTDFEFEPPGPCSFYREAMAHFHLWLVFSMPSAFRFNTAERWTVLFCVLLGVMTGCSVLLAREPGLPWQVFGLISAVLVLPVQYALTRMFIHSPSSVDLALGTRRRCDRSVRNAAYAVCAFWLAACGFVLILFGTELERLAVRKIVQLAVASVIGVVADAVLLQPAHIALFVQWSEGCCGF